MSFASEQLQLQAPVTIMAGFTGVQGFEFYQSDETTRVVESIDNTLYLPQCNMGGRN